MDINNFIKAFDSGVGSCVGICDCGRTFYNSSDVCGLEPEELEVLNGDTSAKDLGCSCGFIEFEGATYVMDCNCWHDRAKKIMVFIDSHIAEIAEYINLERERKIKEANAMPNVQDDL